MSKVIKAVVKKGKEDVIYISPKGKVGLIAHDYRRKGLPLPEPGEEWDVEVIHEAETYFIGMPIARIEPNGTKAD